MTTDTRHDQNRRSQGLCFAAKKKQQHWTFYREGKRIKRGLAFAHLSTMQPFCCQRETIGFEIFIQWKVSQKQSKVHDSLNNVREITQINLWERTTHCFGLGMISLEWDGIRFPTWTVNREWLQSRVTGRKQVATTAHARKTQTSLWGSTESFLGPLAYRTLQALPGLTWLLAEVIPPRNTLDHGQLWNCKTLLTLGVYVLQFGAYENTLWKYTPKCKHRDPIPIGILSLVSGIFTMSLQQRGFLCFISRADGHLVS